MQNPCFQSADETQYSLNTRLNRCLDSIGKETNAWHDGWEFYTVRILRWNGMIRDDNMEELKSILVLELWGNFGEADVWALGTLWMSTWLKYSRIVRMGPLSMKGASGKWRIGRKPQFIIW